MTIDLSIAGLGGPYLDLVAHSPTDIMQVEGLEVRSSDGHLLRWVERPETVRVEGVPLRLSAYRVSGPIPDRIRATYSVQPGRREGDAHIGFTGRCFGYLGPDFSLVTGRDVFLMPAGSEGVRRIDVSFSLPPTWRPMTPWVPSQGGWAVRATKGDPAENLAGSAIAMGRFRERAFPAGKTRVRLAFIEPVVDTVAATHVWESLRASVEYLHGAFGRDLGPDYLVLVAPETPEGCDIAGTGWAAGQGRTLLPLSTERIRGFAEEFIQAYVRYAPYRTEIRRPEEYWLVDAIAGFYSRRAVSRAGMGNDEAVARGLAAGYMQAITTAGVSRNLERFTMGGENDAMTRESIAPYMLLQLDHELKTKYGVPRGVDSLLPRFFARRSAPSLWSLLPRAGSRGWQKFREGYIRGATFAPAPDLFSLRATRPTPTPPRGAPVSRLTIAYTGNTDGYLENCGCKSNQSGGIARRATVLDSVRGLDPETVVLDTGSAFNRPGQYESQNALEDNEQRFYLQMMDRMGYAAGAIGLGELVHGTRYFQDETRGLAMKFLTANVSAKDSRLGSSSIVLNSHGRRIGVIGVFEPSRGGKSQLHLDRALSKLVMEDPLEAVVREARNLRPRTDLTVVIGKLSPLLVRRVAAAVPDLDVIISTDSSAPLWAPGSTPEHRVILEDDRSGFIGGTLVLYATLAQYGLSIANLDLDRTGRITGARLTDSWLTDAVRDEDGMRRALNRFYDHIGSLPEAQASVTPPLVDDPYWRGKRYVGARACQKCHWAEFEQWKGTPHASAYKTLLDKHRHYQPKCVSCHVVGFGSESGYRIGQPEYPMGNVQCEICHGPGAEHVAAPGRTNIRKEVPEHVCLECHNPEHSDRFVYASRLPLVLHRPGERVTMR
jgi:hypothetical protein